MSFKRVAIVLLTVAVIAVSYFYSEKVYGFYLSFYYKEVKDFKPADITKKAEVLLKEGERIECDLFLRKMLLVFVRDIDSLQAISRIYMSMGERERGVALFLQTLEDADITLEEANWIIPELAREGYFGDIRVLLADRNFSGSVRGFYGIALYYTGYFDDAIVQLLSAISEEGGNSTLFYCLSQAYERLGDNSQAFVYMEKAYKLAPNNQSIKKEFFRLSNFRNVLQKKQ